VRKISFFLIILSLLGGGCFLKNKELLKNIAISYQQKENLQGYTKSQILRRFGKPSFKKVESRNGLRIEYWIYQNIYAYMKITFIKGIVTKVEYK